MEIWAEVGACNGDIEYAMSAVAAVREAGAHALKVQWLRNETIFHPDAERYDHTGGSWSTQSDGYPKLLSYEQWSDVYDECNAQDIEFIPAVFDMDAVERAQYLGLSHVKVASGDITNEQLIKYAADTVDHLTISTGAATMEEVERAVGWAQSMKPGLQFTLLACHLNYPTELKDAHLGRMLALTQRFPQFRVGYSDHTEGLDSLPLVYLLGCDVLEKHFTLTPGVGGGDHDMAINPEQLRDAVNITHYINAIVGDIELVPSPEEAAASYGARRPLYALTDIGKGERLSPSNTIPLRPVVEGAYGAEEWSSVVVREQRGGVPVTTDIPAGTAILRRWVGTVGATLSVE